MPDHFGFYRVRDIMAATMFVPRGLCVEIANIIALSGATRDTKYDASMERVAAVIDTFCTFPVAEKQELLRRTLIAFLTGNEDHHLKNFSLITHDRKVTSGART